MRKPREIRRNSLLEVITAGYNGGLGFVKIPDRWVGSVIWGADEEGLEHVSVSPYDQSITPTWDDMCAIKDIFWNEEELVVQVHPPKSEYVNVMTNCLHLWRDKEGRIDELLKGKVKG